MKKILLILGLAVTLATFSQALMVGVDTGVTTLPFISLAQTVTLAPVVAGAPFIGFPISENMNLDLGLTLGSATQNGSSASLYGVWGRLSSVVAQVSKIKLGWGGQLGITSGTATGQPTTTIILLAGLFTAEYMVTDALGIYANINLLAFANTTTNGTTTTLYTLATGDTNCYSGIRLYL